MDRKLNFSYNFYHAKDDGISTFGLIFGNSPKKKTQKVKKYTGN